MGRTNIPLDSSEMGRESSELQGEPAQAYRREEEAIREIVGIYQMYLTGLNAPADLLGTFSSLAYGVGKNAHRGSHGRVIGEPTPVQLSRSIAPSSSTAMRSPS
jgi:hypothetical protein